MKKVFAILLVSIVSLGQVDTEKTLQIKRAVYQYMETAKKEYEQGFFEQALKTLLMAQKHEEYLDVHTNERLKDLIEKSRIAVSKSKETAAQEMTQEEKNKLLVDVAIGAMNIPDGGSGRA